MVQPRFWKPNVLVCLLPVLLLALTGVSAQAQPTAGKTSDPKAYDAQLRRIGNWDGGFPGLFEAISRPTDNRGLHR